MKEIIIRRLGENISRHASYKIVIEGQDTILLANGESKKIMLENTPVTVYAKTGWLTSKDVIVDNSTTELIIKSEQTKNWLAPTSSLLFFVIVLIRIIWPGVLWFDVVAIFSLVILLGWTIYAFIIKSNDWLRIEKITSLHDLP